MSTFGYNCYTECAGRIPGTQVQDPDPLPDVESNLPATTTYTSTKPACASCPAGQINSGGPSEVCQSATRTSLINQADADSKATAAALALATAALNCVQQFTSTQSYKATCAADFALGSLGSDVTRSATATSFNSQQEADDDALAAAKALAIAALVCSGSNSTQKITINDNAPATPYPSVKFVSGLTGLITKVTVAINGLYHGWPEDVHIILKSPNGTLVRLMGNCGGGHAIGSPSAGINLVFDDDAADSLPFAVGSPPVSATIVAGTFKPTGLAPFAILPSPFPGGTINTTLAPIIGENPNGSWALYVFDDAGVQVGAILNGFDLTFQLDTDQVLTSTKFYTATCTAGVIGTLVTKSATRTSSVSAGSDVNDATLAAAQVTADGLALAAATAAVVAAFATECLANATTSDVGALILPAAGWNSNPAPANPFPINRYVSNSGTIHHVRVSFHNIGASANGNSFQVLLRSPQGTWVILWSDQGTLSYGWSDGISIAFDDAGQPMQYNLSSGGIYKPNNGGIPPPYLMPIGPPSPSDYKFTLSEFNGEEQHGMWSLWVTARLTAQSIWSNFTLTIT